MNKKVKKTNRKGGILIMSTPEVIYYVQRLKLRKDYRILINSSDNVRWLLMKGKQIMKILKRISNKQLSDDDFY